MVILYIYSTCWCMKLMFFERQQSSGPSEQVQLCTGTYPTNLNLVASLVAELEDTLPHLLDERRDSA
jgi:hypothetical protein